MKLAILVVAALACSCHESPAQVANQVVVGTEAVACILDVYATDTAQNESIPQAIADVVIQCAKYGVTEAQASDTINAHIAAERKEGFVPKR